MHTRRTLLAMAIALPAAACATPAASQAARSEDDAFLDGLLGDWMFEGQVEGEHAVMRAHGARQLGGAWLELHLIDAHMPPAYEARVFLSYDAEAGDYAAHWLDTFGAAGARVVGTGRRTGDALVIDYPYASGLFRNIWTKTPDGWTLSIDAQQPDGGWSNFASYTVLRP